MSEFFDDSKTENINLNRENGQPCEENSSVEKEIASEESISNEENSSTEGTFLNGEKVSAEELVLDGATVSVDTDSGSAVVESQTELPTLKEKISGYLSTVLLVFLCLFVAFTNFFWIYCVQVEGDSMNSTLNTGDYLFVDRLANIDRGDVIVFTRSNVPPFNVASKSYIKRVVATAGDTVRFNEGNLYLKKKGEDHYVIVDYDGVIGETYYQRDDNGAEYVFTVSENCVYVLGDNRENSTDSRILGEVDLSTVDGVVHEHVIKGKNGLIGFTCKVVFKVREFFNMILGRK